MTGTTRYSAVAGALTALVVTSLVYAHGAASSSTHIQQPRSPRPGPRAPSTVEGRAPADLTVPPGFEVELVAGPPLVNRPIVADFDEEGRLYVADSSGSNDKVEKQLADKPHRIVRLEDTDGDGRFDSSIVFADRMMFPEGAMWFDGSLYVAAPPSIWKLTDTTGDGVADRREDWFEGKTLTSCANDLHGPYLGLDGWIYWTKGAFAQQTYERPGRPPLVTRAAHIFRRQPFLPPERRALGVETVMTGGMDNPVDVDFTPAGERILTATFLEHPQLGRRDAVIHAIYGGVYGKPHTVIEGHQRTGELMPELTHLGPAAPSGLTRYASSVFGDEYRDNFFAALFNLHKVTRHALEPSGATFKSRDSDFLVSSSLDFHPTDVLEDADGSLLVIDTGAWYKLCCPTSQLAKPEVLGAIYRVRRSGAARVADPRGRALAWRTMTPAALAALLDDPRPAVQKRTLHAFSRLGNAAVAALADVMETPRVVARRNAVWALTRIGTSEAHAVVRLALADRDDSVRQAAAHSAGLWRDHEAVPRLLDALQSGPAAVRRAAAEALGRLGDARAVPALLAAAATEGDRILDHSLTYALIEIAHPSSTLAGMRAESSRTRRAALIALDQMHGGGLVAGEVISLLDSSDPLLKDTAWWIAGNHADWGEALADYFETRLSATDLTAAQRQELREKLAQFSANPSMRELLGATIARAGSRELRLTALEAMARARFKVLPGTWLAPLGAALRDSDTGVARAAVTVFRQAPPPDDLADEVGAALLQVGRDTQRPVELRLDALAALPGGLTTVEAELFDLLRASLAPERPPLLRGAAAGVLEKAALDREQLIVLADAVADAGPLELPRLLPAFDRGSDEALGLRLIAALERSKGRSTVRPDILRPRLAKYPESVQKQGEALLKSLDANAASQGQRLEELLGALGDGDVRRGQLVFNSAKTACLSCHAIGYLGGKIGPDLTRIGQIRSERDLLEAIVFPSASFARSYEPVVVSTASGAVHSGVIRNESADEVLLATGPQAEVRIARQEIEDIQPGTVSVMPPGLDEQLTRQELADLLAFLKATRSGAN